MTGKIKLDLFEKEYINFDITESRETTMSDDKINKKYVAGEVRIVTEQARYPLNTISSLLDSGNYNLRPIFQRRHRWDNVRRSKLIESLIMNVPIPPIFLYENEFSHYEVMDGLQRLTAISEFYKDRYELEGLEVWKELNGKTYSMLPEKIKQGIDRRYISSIILLQESAKDEKKAQEMKQIVFERINSGGVKLEGQEIRNALFNGPMNELCKKLSKYPKFKIVIGVEDNEEFDEGVGLELLLENEDPESTELDNGLMNNDRYRKMEDVEFVLRFFAMRQTPAYSQTTISKFFDTYLINANNFDKDVLDKLSKLFIDTVDLVYDLFGEKAFYLYRHKNTGIWSWYHKPTTVIYDPMMFALSKYLNKKKDLMYRKEDINSNFEFNDRANNLISYLEILARIKNIKSHALKNAPIEIQELINFRDRKRYNYDIAIINLYGILEGFIENIIIAYLKTITQIFIKYSLMPQKIIENHLRLSTTLLNNTSNKYDHISNEVIVKNLHRCLTDIVPFDLNYEAFTQHTSNFRINTIGEIFKTIDIHDMVFRLQRESGFIDFISAYQNVDKSLLIELKDKDIFFKILDDIVDRRNWLSHGVLSDDLLDERILIDYANYIKILMQSVYNIMQNYVDIITFKNKNRVQLHLITTFNNQILCIHSNNLEIKLGLNVYAYNESKDIVMRGKIDSIQIDNNSVDFVDKTQNVNIGLKMDIKVKPNWKYYLILD